ncbi:MAG: PQQ-dependent sugar dehydrogenase [Acidimicrobiia bacterium]
MGRRRRTVLLLVVGVVALGAVTVGVLSRSDTPAEPPRTSGLRFAKGRVEGADTTKVTTVRFGPDGRLYVGQQTGIIRALSLERRGPASYRVTASEAIGALVDLPNHNDDGVENRAVVGRQLTGIEVTGTATQPVIYAVTTDPRMGGGPSGLDLPLDTNSGVLSRLTRDGASWRRTDLVRGLPRSGENHAGNGLVLDGAGSRLFLAQGANTNNGAPSKQFAFTPEYALSGAILSIDLAAIGEGTFDLPTLDDPARPGTADAGDPFGGAKGANQARLAADGPVTVYAPGFRNPYDIVLTAAGRLYTIDNGANPGWGDAPLEAGGRCTSDPRPGGKRQEDTLHYVRAAGYYGGHPNPTRANPANVFAGQSPVGAAHPIECEFRPGKQSGALTTFPASTNGLVEYRSQAFGGAMAGNLLTASFDNRIYRLKLHPDGRLSRKEILFEDVGQVPLDLTAQGDREMFPGTIWVGDIADGSITVFEPTP